MADIVPAGRRRAGPVVFPEKLFGGVQCGVILRRMNTILAPITRDRAARLARRLRLWLALWLARLADLLGDGAPLGRVLRGLVHDRLVALECTMKATLVLMAYARDPWIARRRRWRPPFRTPDGFRRHVYRGSALRHVTRGILGRCDLLARVTRLRLLLEHPDRAVAHIRARILRGLTNGRLMIAAPVRCTPRPVSAPALTCADTS